MNIDDAEHICHLRLSDDPSLAIAMQTILMNFGLEGMIEFMADYVYEEKYDDEFFDDDDDDLFDGYSNFDDEDEEQGDLENA